MPNDSSTTAYTDSLDSLSSDISFYVSVTILPLSCFNLVGIAIYSQQKFRNDSTAYLFIWQLSLHTLSCIFGSTIKNFLPRIGLNLQVGSEFSCKFFAFMRRLLSAAGSFAQCFVTVDTFVNVRFPRRFDRLSKNRPSVTLVIFIMLIFLSVMSTGALFTTRADEVTLFGNVTTKTYSCNSSQIVSIESDIMQIMLRNTVPLITMVSLSWLIYQEISKSKRSANQINGQNGENKEKKFLISVMAFNFIFFICFMPSSATYILHDVYKYYVPNSAVITAQLTLATNIADSLSYLYEAMPFIWMMIFNKVFRSEVLRLLCSKLCLKRPSASVAPLA